MEPDTVYYCKECGSTDVYLLEWYGLNPPHHTLPEENADPYCQKCDSTTETLDMDPGELEETGDD